MFADPGPQETPLSAPRPSKVWLHSVVTSSTDWRKAGVKRSHEIDI